MEYPVIDRELDEQLARVPASVDGECRYHPCRVRFRSGDTRDFVVMTEADRYIDTWGVWPEEDEAKESVAVEDIVEVDESPHRLPVDLANKLYKVGESGMGYFVFTLVLRDGRRLPYVTGNVVDFPSLPVGVSSDDITDALPNEGLALFTNREPQPNETSAPYVWCLVRRA